MNGRDEMVRLLYGGRNSLFIALVSTLVTLSLATLLALLAGYFRGWVDAVISRFMDVLWSTPVVLLGVALGVATALGGVKPRRRQAHGRFALAPGADHRRDQHRVCHPAAARCGALAARAAVH